MIEEAYAGDLFAAVQATLPLLRGAFALGVIARDQPDRIVAARIGSPLIIGSEKGKILSPRMSRRFSIPPIG